jgi:hypothetical protein
MKALIEFLKFCADERNVKMFKAGARAGGETVVALADDLHTVSKIAVGSKEGAGLALLRTMFPTTANVVERNVEKIDSLEMSLFPTLPEDGEVYMANVEGSVLMKGGVQGYRCVIPMRPPFHLMVEYPHPKEGEDHPMQLRVKCLERDDDAWLVIEDSEVNGLITIEYT